MIVKKEWEGEEWKREIGIEWEDIKKENGWEIMKMERIKMEEGIEKDKGKRIKFKLIGIGKRKGNDRVGELES